MWCAQSWRLDTVMRGYGMVLRMLVATLLCGVAQYGMAQTDGFDLYVSYTDGRVVSLDLAHLRSMTFSYNDRTMIANYRDGSSYTHSYEHMGRMYFAAASGIGVVTADDRRLFSLEGTTLALHEGVRSAMLYRLDGSCMMTITDRVVSLHGLPAGVYMLRVDNQTAKLCVR